jgi:PilZ domain
MKSLQVARLAGTVGPPSGLHAAFHRREGRLKKRFGIVLPLTYKVVKGKGGAGSGTTINISSTGVLFTTDPALVPGLHVELSLPWPAMLNDTVPMKLVIEATVIRASATEAAAKIRSYEFRTQRQKPRTHATNVVEWSSLTGLP